MIRSIGVLAVLIGTAHAAQVVIDGPQGNGAFGLLIVTLPNGNIVVRDPFYDAPGPVVDVGAVYLYRPDGTLISALRGSSERDQIGTSVTVLANGNFVIASPSWDNGAFIDAGAVTFASGTTGVSGLVSPENSLVGSSFSDFVGLSGVTALSNGNYIVRSPEWRNGSAFNAGAVTFGSGTTGVRGVVSPANSLVGTAIGDAVGWFNPVTLPNGNYLVRMPDRDNGSATDAGALAFGSGTTGITGPVSPQNSLFGTSANDAVGSVVRVLDNSNFLVLVPRWDDGALVDVGAVTFGSGTVGVTGAVSAENSLIGSSAGHQVGNAGVTLLTNGDYVVGSRTWSNGAVGSAGAVTYGSGTDGIVGVVSAGNSLVGRSTNDQVGSVVTALANGNYVVQSPLWDNGAIADAGAVTLVLAGQSTAGVVSSANSLVGSSAGDQLGSSGVAALANGNYAVASPLWDDGPIADAGAVTFRSGSSSTGGLVSSDNSLVGRSASDLVGFGGVTALANGNYVVSSPNWDAVGVADVGAVSFGSGTTGISGAVSAVNSLVGGSFSDRVGNTGVTALTNGNYVVRSAGWDNAGIVDAGAATFGSGSTGVSGPVTALNSLVGSSASDQVGVSGVSALIGGNYVVRSAFWSDGALASVGAATFGDGTTGTVGVIHATNSLLGSSVNDRVGDGVVTVLANGNYVLRSALWDNGAAFDAGAVTLGLNDGSVTGGVSDSNSVLGLFAERGVSQTFGYDPFRNQLAVGQPYGNRVVLHRPGIATTTRIVGSTPDPAGPGQSVTFTAAVSATPGAPSDGQVTFAATGGERCVATTPIPSSPTTTEFSCALTFTLVGTTEVVAEYTGSVIHAYSRSAPEPHSTDDTLFGDGFEGP